MVLREANGHLVNPLKEGLILEDGCMVLSGSLSSCDRCRRTMMAVRDKQQSSPPHTDRWLMGMHMAQVFVTIVCGFVETIVSSKFS